MKKIISTTILITLCWMGLANPQLEKMQKAILEDFDMAAVIRLAESTIKNDLNEEQGFDYVQIREYNTFITTAMDYMPDEKIRECLDLFFLFQGKDGSIADAWITKDQIDTKKDKAHRYFTSSNCPNFYAFKNSVSTDQEASLVQAVGQYVNKSGNNAYLQSEINGKTVAERLEMAINYLLTRKYNQQYGLITGATTADWGDVQPEDEYGMNLTKKTHYCIDIYDNSMLIIALENLANMTKNENWKVKAEEIRKNARKYLWDEKNQKFIPHLYLNGSPFPEDFDENSIYPHGGTAMAALAGLMSPEEISAAYQRMVQNMRKAHAHSIGISQYPPYPNNYFKNKDMYPYHYLNGGDWSWMGARMVCALAQNGFICDAYNALLPMLQRAAAYGNFYHWYTPSGAPEGTGGFKGEAGVLMTAIKMLKAWAVDYEVLPLSEIEGTTVLFTFGQSNAANCGRGFYRPKTKVLNYYDGHVYPGKDPMIGASGDLAGPWPRLAEKLNNYGMANGVTVIAAGVGGSKVADWQNGGIWHQRLIDNIERAKRDGIHIDYILWHQGESDHIFETTKEQYIERFLNIRHEFRSRGIDAPIIIAKASYHPWTMSPNIPTKGLLTNNGLSDDIRDAQAELAEKYDDIYEGPDTDQWRNVEWRNDGVHFSHNGLEIHSEGWIEAIRKVMAEQNKCK